MRFIFFVLINLVVVNSIGSSNFDSNLYLRYTLPDNCSTVVKEIIKHFRSFEESERRQDIEYGEDAYPYVYLLSLDVTAELCKAPDLLKKLNQLRKPKVCPMSYPLKSTNLKVDITKGVQYMKNEVNCKVVCASSRDLSYICNYIACANEIIMENSLKSTGASSDYLKGDVNQSVHLPKKDGVDNLTGGGGISQDIKLAQETKSKTYPKQLIEKIVQSVTDNKSEINKPVTKTEDGTVNKMPITQDSDMKPSLEITRPDSSVDKNYKYKVINDRNSSNVSDYKTVLKNGTFKNNDNSKIKTSANDKTQILPSDIGNTNNPGTESPPPPPPPALTENDYSPKKQQNNGNNDNKNNNNMEFEDDPTFKTPHDEGEDDDDNNNEDVDKSVPQDALLDGDPQFAKSVNPKEIYTGDNFFQAEDSHFSVYFLTTVSVIIVGYVIYHNKKKILAYALEGRRNKNGRRRPTSASYRKLDCNLEEAIASNPSNTSVTNVVY